MIVALKQFRKFVELAADDPRFTHESLEAQNIIATINNTVESGCNLGGGARLEKQAAEMAILAKKQEDEERRRLLELEAQALEAEARTPVGE